MSDKGKTLLVAAIAVVFFATVACAKDTVSRNSHRDAGGGKDASPARDAETADGDSGAGGDVKVTEPSGACNLTGKWISTERTLNIALGGQVIQSGHSWAYWEFEPSDTAGVFDVKKGLQCGEEVKDRSPSPVFATTITSSKAVWDGLTLHNKMEGRKASYGALPGSDQCALNIEPGVIIRGATFEYFSAFKDFDFVNPIDDAKVEAQGSAPGWEDWDNDGHPGVTYHVSGIATGDLYMAQRDLTKYDGNTPKDAEKFKLDVTWLHQQLVVDKDPAGLPSADVTQSPDQSENFIWFGRVDGLKEWNPPANADDLTICATMREVKDTAIPEGNE